jgi:uncharacterized glyoxalase superfamily protein PhnB
MCEKMTVPSTTILRGPEPLLYVTDINRSVDFYSRQLGFTLTESYSPHDQLCWCRLQRGGSAFMLQLASEKDGSSAQRTHGVIFYFFCTDADALHTEFTAAGLTLAPPQKAFYGMNQLSLTDPDGYALCFQNQVAN